MDLKRLANVLRGSITPYKLSVYQLLREQSIADSAAYAAEHLGTAMIFDMPVKLWTYGASRAHLESGLVMEFGVFRGRSINHFAKHLPDVTLHGFDSFEGLAEDWTGYHLPKGTFNLGGKLPAVADNVKLHKGWFNETLPEFLNEHDENIRLCHIDCDTYESSRYVLELLVGRFVAGSIIIFDEYYGYPNWRAGEFLAWQEIVAQNDIKYRYIALANMQAAVEIL